jgi:hypothetical protein
MGGGSAYGGLVAVIGHRLTPYWARPNGRGKASEADATLKADKKHPLILKPEGDCKSYGREIKHTRAERLLLFSRSTLERVKDRSSRSIRTMSPHPRT